MEETLEKVEIIKQNSNHLRGTIKEVLESDSDSFEEDDKQLLKFHGLYQQKWRGKELPKEQQGHSFMIRGRIPGGRLTSEQYSVWDALGDKYGGGALRLTTRQSVQLHGLLKGSLKDIMKQLYKISLSSMGACGDVVRNVTQAVNFTGSKEIHKLDEIANLLSDHFKYKSRSYPEIWLDEEKLDIIEEEPIYKDAYLPRKFKIAVTLTGNNSVDIYTNDMGFAATIGKNGEIEGYFVFAGGGLGMTHNKAATFPRKADCLGWIEAKDLIPVAEGIVTAHRDYGDRTNRKHARLKYVLADKGVDWFRAEVEKRANIKFINKELPEWNTPNYLGWHTSTDGTLSLGFHTLAGRIKDTPEKSLKSALKEIISNYKLSVQITADQDLILIGIQPSDKEKILKRLNELHVNPESPSPLFNRALACPALPTCALALTESERFLPDVLKEFKVLLDKYDLMNKAPVIRMTGCPNGCARPYAAEIGLVGQQNGGKYAIYLGGDKEGTKMGSRIADKKTIPEIVTLFDPIFKKWKEEGKEDEYLGDFVERVGVSSFE
ncbi:MAG: NADPH-dependent assimilatory sulfite reductase hemoprotein subunit [Leptospiraceae bacterium]|nr:NADPH-dependent assimilatory sulfite reductase hemoprotein subunit [Leptospiraceae bacterium]